MNDYVYGEFIENFESADIILTLVFALLDFIILLLSLFNLQSKNGKIFLLKNKLFALFIVDIVLRILYANNNNKIKSLFKECLFSALTVIQFLLILSFLEQAYKDSKKSKKDNFYKALKKKHLCFIFLIVTFPYEKFSYSQKEICFIQCLIIIYCIFVLYSLLNKKIIKIVKPIINKVTIHDKNIFLCLLGSPLPCLILFISYYILRIIFLSVENPDFILYSNIILKIIKECSKYFLFFILEILVYVLSENRCCKEQLYSECDEKNVMKQREFEY